jgi:hypothetical protein
MSTQTPLAALKNFRGSFTVLTKNPDNSYINYVIHRTGEDEYIVNNTKFTQRQVLEHLLFKHVCYIASVSEVWTCLDKVTKTIQKNWRQHHIRMLSRKLVDNTVFPRFHNFSKKEFDAAQSLLAL